MSIKVKLCRGLMNLFPYEPVFDITRARSENINHESFINASEDKKDVILFEMAKNHYLEDQKKPFDHYFPDYKLNDLLFKKNILDLGCWCGGKSVSCAERWKVKSMFGIDINEYFIRAATLFSSKRENQCIEYRFTIGFGEDIPFGSKKFDAIISSDVFEHVKSLDKTLRECKRVLKPGGMIFTVFPSYYFPFGGAHLDFVTRTPCLNWLFDPGTLNIAYHEIIELRGEKAYWYKSSKDEDWRTLHGGIGINGVTFKEFKSIVREVGFSKLQFIETPLFSVGRISIRHPKIRSLSRTFRFLLRIESLQDFLSHRIVAIIVV